MTERTIEIPEEQLDTIVENKVEEHIAERQQKTSRRSVLGALAGVAGAGALGYGAGTAGASDPSDASGTVYFEQIGDSDHPVEQLYVQNQTNFSETEEVDDLTVNNQATIGSANIEDASIERTGLYVHLSSDQTVSDSTETKIQLDSVDTDHFNGFDANNHEYVIPDAGYYRFKLFTQWSSFNSNNQVDITIIKNGSTERQYRHTGQQVSYNTLICEAEGDYNEGDIIDCRVEHNSGADETLWGGGSVKTTLKMWRSE